MNRLGFARWVVTPWPRAHLTTFGAADGPGIRTLCGLVTASAGTYDYLPDEKVACKHCTYNARKQLEVA